MPPTVSGLHRMRTRKVGYQVRLDLVGVKPPIWRRLQLPSDLRLDELHHVIQTAMGWDDAHLHAFSTGSGRDGIHFRSRDPFGDTYSEEPALDEHEARLDQVLHDVDDILTYEYDFGDSWEHRLKLEKILDRAPDGDAVRLITGRRACPPEDCGGIYAYVFYQSVAQSLADGDEIDEADLENFRHVYSTETGRQVLDRMAAFDVEQTAKAVATIR